MTLREIKKTIRSLTPQQLVKLDAWLHELINDAESKKHARNDVTSGRQVLEE